MTKKLRSGRRGRAFESPHPDKETKLEAQMADSSAICLFMRKYG